MAFGQFDKDFRPPPAALADIEHPFFPTFAGPPSVFPGPDHVYDFYEITDRVK